MKSSCTGSASGSPKLLVDKDRAQPYSPNRLGDLDALYARTCLARSREPRSNLRGGYSQAGQAAAARDGRRQLKPAPASAAPTRGAALAHRPFCSRREPEVLPAVGLQPEVVA